jgi:hypothetical protein
MRITNEIAPIDVLIAFIWDGVNRLSTFLNMAFARGNVIAAATAKSSPAMIFVYPLF